MGFFERFGGRKHEASPIDIADLKESASVALGRALENLPMQGDQGEIMEIAITKAKTTINFDSLPPQAQQALDAYFKERQDNAHQIGVIGEHA